jgi:phage replication O-like protein O
MKIQAPNYTQSPNILFDEIFKTLKEGELRIVLVLIRQTFGWHKEWDRITIGILAKKTGMERKSVYRSLKSLIEKGLIEEKRFGKNGNERLYFRLVMEEMKAENFDDDEISEEEMEMLSNNSYPRPKVPQPASLDLQTHVPRTHTKETITKEKKQQQAAPAAAVFSASKKKIQKEPVIHECLNDIDIPQSDKVWITSRYDESTVRNAVVYSTHKDHPPTNCLAASIKWACKDKPEVSKNKEEVEDDNRKYAAKYDGLKNKIAKIECCSKHVEIVHGGASAAGVFIKYEEKGFMEKFKEALKTNKFRILE